MSSIIDTITTEQRESTEKARSQYIALIRLDAQGEATNADTAKLRAAMATLGVTAEQAQQDRDAIAEALRLREHAAARGGELAAMNKAGEQLEQHEAETKRIMGERESERRDLERQITASRRRAEMAADSARDLQRLKRQHPDLLADIEAPESKGETIPPTGSPEADERHAQRFRESMNEARHPITIQDAHRPYAND